jgi:hypothetical protein
MARRFGSIFVLALAQNAEARSPYSDEPYATPAMAADERVHHEVERGLAARGRRRLSGTFRAAVFGANDGLVSNLALVLGIGATGVAPQFVLFSGIAGLLAGALSMGAGEFVSVRSQRELLAATEPSDYADAALSSLDLDANELALVYRTRGMPLPEALEPEPAELELAAADCWLVPVLPVVLELFELPPLHAASIIMTTPPNAIPAALVRMGWEVMSFGQFAQRNITSPG